MTEISGHIVRHHKGFIEVNCPNGPEGKRWFNLEPHLIHGSKRLGTKGKIKIDEEGKAEFYEDVAQEEG